MSRHPSNPFGSGNQSSAQGLYAFSGMQPKMDPNRVPSHLGPESISSPGVSFADSGIMIPQMSPSMSHRPEHSRTRIVEDVEMSVDMPCSRAREEVRYLGNPDHLSMGQIARFTSSQRDEYVSSGRDTFSYPQSSSSAYNSQEYTDVESNRSSMDWLPKYKGSTGEGSSTFYSSSSSSSHMHSGDGRISSSTERERDVDFIPGLGDCDYRAPGKRAEPPEKSHPQYTSQSAVDILSRFGLEKEDLEYLISYPEDQLTPTNLPFILHQIRMDKDRNSTVEMKPYSGSQPIRGPGVTDSASITSGSSAVLQTPKVIDYGHTGKYVGGTLDDIGRTTSANIDGAVTLDTDEQRTTSGSRNPSKKETHQFKTSPLVSSLDQSRSSTGFGSSYPTVAPPNTDRDQKTSITSVGSLYHSANLSNKVLHDQSSTAPQLSSSYRPIITQNKDQNITVAGLSSSYHPVAPQNKNPHDQSRSVTSLRTSYHAVPLPSFESSKRSQKPQHQTSVPAFHLFPLPKTDMHSVVSATESKALFFSDPEPEAKLKQPQPIRKGLVLIDRTYSKDNKGESKSGGQKPALVLAQSKKEQEQKKYDQKLKQTPHHLEKQPLPKQSMKNRTISQTGKVLWPLAFPSAVTPPGAGSATQCPQPSAQQTTGPWSYFDFTKKNLIKPAGAQSQPTPAMMHDYLALHPKVFPHTCSLCHIECYTLQDWISHQNTNVHLERCRHLRTLYPQWNGDIIREPSSTSKDAKSSSSAAAKTSQKTKRKTSQRSHSHSRSASPRRHRSSEGKRETRSRSRSSGYSRSRSRSPCYDYYRSRSRSRERQRRSNERRSGDRWPSPKRSRERQRREDRWFSPPRQSQRKRDDWQSSEEMMLRRSSERHSSPKSRVDKRTDSRERRSSNEIPPQLMKSSNAKRLVKKLLEQTAGQAQSESDLEAVVKTLLAEISKKKSSSLSNKSNKQLKYSASVCEGALTGASSSSTAASKRETTSSQTSLTKSKLAKLPVQAPTMVRLNGVTDSLSRSDVVAALGPFGKIKSALLLRKVGQAVVCFEKEEDAKKVLNAKRINVKGTLVTVVRKKDLKLQITPQKKTATSTVSTPETPENLRTTTTTIRKVLLPTPRRPPEGTKKPFTGQVKKVTTGKFLKQTSHFNQLATIKRLKSKCSVKASAVVSKAKVLASKAKHVSKSPEHLTRTTESLNQTATDRKPKQVSQTPTDSLVVAENVAVENPLNVLETKEQPPIMVPEPALGAEREVSDKLVKVDSVVKDDEGAEPVVLEETEPEAVEPMEEKGGGENLTNTEGVHDKVFETGPQTQTDVENPPDAPEVKVQPSVMAPKPALEAQPDVPAKSAIVDAEVKGNEVAEPIDLGDTEPEAVEPMEEERQGRENLTTTEGFQDKVCERGPQTQTDPLDVPETKVQLSVVAPEPALDAQLEVSAKPPKVDAEVKDNDGAEPMDLGETEPESVEPMEEEGRGGGGENLTNTEGSQEKVSESGPQTQTDPTGPLSRPTLPLQKSEVTLEADAAPQRSHTDMKTLKTSVQASSQQPEPEASAAATQTKEEATQPSTSAEVMERKDFAPARDTKMVRVVSKASTGGSSSATAGAEAAASAGIPILTPGEMMENFLSSRQMGFMKWNTVFSQKLHPSAKTVVLITNLPFYEREPYTEEELAYEFERQGFRLQDEDIYVVPQAGMAICCLSTKLLKVCVARQIIFKKKWLNLKALNAGPQFKPRRFYTYVMGKSKNYNLDQVVYVKNISWGQTRELRKVLNTMAGLVNFLPLLNKIFIEFETKLHMDALEVWYMRQYPTPNYRLCRMTGSTMEDLGTFLSGTQLDFLDWSKVFASDFMQRSCAVVVFTNLPDYRFNPFTEEELAKVLVTHGFVYEEQDIYVVPQRGMAFCCVRPEVARRIRTQHVMFEKKQLTVRVLDLNCELKPFTFYKFLMQKSKTASLKSNFGPVMYVRNISTKQTQDLRHALRSRTGLVNFLPLLNKVFIEFDTKIAAKALEVWYKRWEPTYKMCQINGDVSAVQNQAEKSGPSALPPRVTVGEKIETFLDENKMDICSPQTVMSHKFMKQPQRVVLILNLPAYHEGGYTEKELANVLSRHGFTYENETIYVLPKAAMAFCSMPPLLVRTILQKKIVFKEKTLRLMPLNVCSPLSPFTFYQFLMRETRNSAKPFDGSRIIYVKNISPSQTRELRAAVAATSGLVNFLPLLNKVFVEYESMVFADVLGIWYSFLKRAPDYRIYRMSIPTGARRSLVCCKSLPKEIAKSQMFVPATFIPHDVESPLWITIPTRPFVFPTCQPWFRVPRFVTVKHLRQHSLSFGSSSSFPIIMLTGLPQDHYTHLDVVRLVWPYFPQQNLQALYYDVVVLTLQRRAFVRFSSLLNFHAFVGDYEHGAPRIRNHSVSIHLITQSMVLESTEELMFMSLLELSNAPAADPNGLVDRLLCVEIAEATVNIITVIMEVVSSIADFVRFLPLANRIIVEMADSSGVLKVVETYKEHAPSSGVRCATWRKVVRFESAKTLKQRLEDAGDATIALEPEPEPFEVEQGSSSAAAAAAATATAEATADAAEAPHEEEQAQKVTGAPQLGAGGAADDEKVEEDSRVPEDEQSFNMEDFVTVDEVGYYHQSFSSHSEERELRRSPEPLPWRITQSVDGTEYVSLVSPSSSPKSTDDSRERSSSSRLTSEPSKKAMRSSTSTRSPATSSSRSSSHSRVSETSSSSAPKSQENYVASRSSSSGAAMTSLAYTIKTAEEQLDTSLQMMGSETEDLGKDDITEQTKVSVKDSVKETQDVNNKDPEQVTEDCHGKGDQSMTEGNEEEVEGKTTPAEYCVSSKETRKPDHILKDEVLPIEDKEGGKYLNNDVTDQETYKILDSTEDHSAMEEEGGQDLEVPSDQVSQEDIYQVLDLVEDQPSGQNDKRERHRKDKSTRKDEKSSTRSGRKTRTTAAEERLQRRNEDQQTDKVLEEMEFEVVDSVGDEPVRELASGRSGRRRSARGKKENPIQASKKPAAVTSLVYITKTAKEELDTSLQVMGNETEDLVKDDITKQTKVSEKDLVQVPKSNKKPAAEDPDPHGKGDQSKTEGNENEVEGKATPAQFSKSPKEVIDTFKVLDSTVNHSAMEEEGGQDLEAHSDKVSQEDQTTYQVLDLVEDQPSSPDDKRRRSRKDESTRKDEKSSTRSGRKTRAIASEEKLQQKNKDQQTEEVLEKMEFEVIDSVGDEPVRETASGRSGRRRSARGKKENPVEASKKPEPVEVKQGLSSAADADADEAPQEEEHAQKVMGVQQLGAGGTADDGKVQEDSRAPKDEQSFNLEDFVTVDEVGYYHQSSANSEEREVRRSREPLPRRITQSMGQSVSVSLTLPRSSPKSNDDSRERSSSSHSTSEPPKKARHSSTPTRSPITSSSRSQSLVPETSSSSAPKSQENQPSRSSSSGVAVTCLAYTIKTAEEELDTSLQVIGSGTEGLGKDDTTENNKVSEEDLVQVDNKSDENCEQVTEDSHRKGDKSKTEGNEDEVKGKATPAQFSKFAKEARKPDDQITKNEVLIEDKEGGKYLNSDLTYQETFKVLDSTVDQSAMEEDCGQHLEAPSDQASHEDEDTYQVLDLVEDQPSGPDDKGRGSRKDKSTRKDEKVSLQSGQKTRATAAEEKKSQRKNKDQQTEEVLGEMEFEVIDFVGDEPVRESSSGRSGRRRSIRGKKDNPVAVSKKTEPDKEISYQILDSVEEKAVTVEPTRGRRERSTRREAFIDKTKREDTPTRRRQTSARETPMKGEETPSEGRTPPKKTRAREVTEDRATYEILDSVDDEDEQPTTRGRGKPKKEKGAPPMDTTVIEVSQEEATYEILDSLEDEDVKEGHPVKTRGRRGRSKEETITKNKTETLKKGSRDVFEKEANEEKGCSYQILDVVELETGDDGPATERSKSRRMTRASKNDKRPTNEGASHARSPGCKDKEEPLYQIVDSVDDNQAQDFMTTVVNETIHIKDEGHPKQKTQGIIIEMETVVEIKEKTKEKTIDMDPPAEESKSPLERKTSQEEDKLQEEITGLPRDEEEPLYEIVDSLEEDQVQEEVSKGLKDDICPKKESQPCCIGAAEHAEETDQSSKVSNTTSAAEDFPMKKTDIRKATTNVLVSLDEVSDEEENFPEDMEEEEEEMRKKHMERLAKYQQCNTRGREDRNIRGADTREEMPTCSSVAVEMDKKAVKDLEEVSDASSTVQESWETPTKVGKQDVTAAQNSLVNLDVVSDEEEDFPDDTAEEEDLRKKYSAVKEQQLTNEHKAEREKVKTREREDDRSCRERERTSRSSRGGGRGGRSRRVHESSREIEVNIRELVTLDEVGADEIAEEVSLSRVLDGEFTMGELQGLVTLDEIVEEEADRKMEPITQEDTGPPTLAVQSAEALNIETLVSLDEAGGDDEEKVETPEKTPISLKRKLNLEESVNFVTVDEVGEEDEEDEEKPTVKTRGRAKRTRKAPVRKSARGKNAAAKDECEEQRPRSEEPSEHPATLDKDQSQSRSEHQPEIVKVEAEGEGLGQELQLEDQSLKEPGEKGRGSSDEKAVSKRKAELLGPESKRSRFRSPSCALKLPPFHPDRNFGQEFVVPTLGFFCNVCRVFYVKNEGEDKDPHCSSRQHYENLQNHLQNLQPKPSS